MCICVYPHKPDMDAIHKAFTDHTPSLIDPLHPTKYSIFVERLSSLSERNQAHCQESSNRDKTTQRA